MLENFEFWDFFIGLFTGGMGSALITYKITKHSIINSGDGNTVNQSASTTGGDIVGRDKISS